MPCAPRQREIGVLTGAKFRVRHLTAPPKTGLHVATVEGLGGVIDPEHQPGEPAKPLDNGRPHAIETMNEDPTMSDIAERVKKIVVEHLGVDAEKVTENANFIDDLGADSLDTVELVMAFEEEFNVEIPDDAAETIVTVGDAIKFLEKNAA
ncbi:hypothetical protein GCM10010994_29480 [Chelatococcus reniformis]|uniref:Acyl carrier protein n=2 Tax=Chelatococcus reniformis TaxID=1494448 RepID=A0A916XFA1_9HYPH|nr:hypothetical protein GCM10010994_29480 [Chelatococcus reniformis]